jgi:Tfp pilus assembly protein PilW
MSRPRSARGTGLVELIVGTSLALVVLIALTATVGSGARLLLACGARGEAEDTAQLALEAFTFDARRAGYDPTARGLPPLSEARSDRVGFSADLDGDGAIDGTSEESTAWVCLGSPGRLSRVIGRQSLPLADGVVGCAFRYLDRQGNPIAVPPTGLDPADRAGVGGVALDLTLLPNGLAGRSERAIVIALRGAS